MNNITNVTPIKVLRKPTIKMSDLKTKWIKIFRTQSNTGETEQMMAEIKSQLDTIAGVSYRLDDYGNLYATKGKAETYPIYVCHTDTVHKIYDVEPILFRSKLGDYRLFIEDTDHKPVGDDNKTVVNQIGIGGDDKCGIIACIEFLHRLPVVKCAFFLDEEAGCLGSKVGDLSFFDNGRFAIQVDRKNNCDIITRGSGEELCGDEFKDHISAIGEVYGYAPTFGANTDVVQLKERGLKLACVNLSAGYHNPHSKMEYVNERDFLNCLEFCIAMSKFKTVYLHEKKVWEAPKSTYQPPYWNGRYGNARDYKREAPTETVVADRRCFGCGLTLRQDKDGLVCDKCMKSSFISSFVVSGEDGTQILYRQTAPRLLGKDLQLPSDNCLLCITQPLKPEQKEFGYCDSCAHCVSCGKILTTSAELVESACPDCEHDHPFSKCAIKDCTNILGTSQELVEQICSLCSEEYQQLWAV